MLIGIDGSRAFVEGRSGTENYSYQLIKHLSLIDTENKYLIYIRPGQKPDKDWPGNFQFSILNFQFLWTQIGLAWQTFRDPLDILFVPAHTLPLIRRPGLKTVITVHDLGAEYLPGFHQLKQILYLKLMTYYQLKTASKLIAVSEATKRDIIKRVQISPKKIDVVYEGVDRKVFNSELSVVSKAKNDIQRDVLMHYNLPPKTLGKAASSAYFLFVGTIQPRKNLERLIRAFALFARGPAAPVSRRMSSVTSFPAGMRREPSFASPLATNYQLILVGQKGWQSKEIYDLPQKLGIGKQVRFLGRVSDQELVVLYSSALALTYPSLFEGFGLPILEAFASGCPVITSNVSSMPEIAGDAAILVDPYKEKDISKAMLEVVGNDKIRNRLIQKGYDRVKEFDWEKTAHKTVEIFNELMKK